MRDEPRAIFPNRWLPYLLVAPQIAITVVFFFWPAGQAVWQSMLREDPFGLRTRFVGLDNLGRVLGDPDYLNSLEVTVVFSTAVALGALAAGLLLAVMADRVIRGRGGLSHAPPVALRDRARHRGDAVAVPVQPVDGDAGDPAAPRRVRLESPAQRRSGDGAGGRRRGLEA